MPVGSEPELRQQFVHTVEQSIGNCRSEFLECVRKDCTIGRAWCCINSNVIAIGTQHFERKHLKHVWDISGVNKGKFAHEGKGQAQVAPDGLGEK